MSVLPLLPPAGVAASLAACSHGVEVAAGPRLSFRFGEGAVR